MHNKVRESALHSVSTSSRGAHRSLAADSKSPTVQLPQVSVPTSQFEVIRFPDLRGPATYNCDPPLLRILKDVHEISLAFNPHRPASSIL